MRWVLFRAELPSWHSASVSSVPPPSQPAVDPSIPEAPAPQQQSRLWLWAAVVAGLVGVLWWLGRVDEPPAEAPPSRAPMKFTPQTLTQKESPEREARRKEFMRQMVQRRGPHLFDDKRPPWDPNRIQVRPLAVRGRDAGAR